MGPGQSGVPRGVPPANHRLTVGEAAARLGITKGAVRSRIKRGTLPSAREAGRVYVVWGGGTSAANHATDTGVPSGEPRDQSELVAVLREQLAAEREAHAETRRIAAMLAARVGEIEAPSERRDAPRTGAEPSEGASPRSGTAGRQEGVVRSFLRRLIGSL